MSADFFHFNFKFLTLFGLHSPKHPKWKALYRTLLIPHWILSLTAILMEIASIATNRDNIQRTILNVGTISLHTAAAIRLLGWWVTKDRFESVLDIIGRPSFNFRIFDYTGNDCVNLNIARQGRALKHKYIYNKKAAGFKRNAIDVFQQKQMQTADRFCRTLFLTVFFYICCNLTVSYSTNCFKQTYEKFNPNLNKTSLYRDFVYPLWFPFDVSISDGHYWIAFFYQPYAFFSLMTGFWCIDCIILSAIIHLQRQVKVVSFALQQVDKNIYDKAVEKQLYLVQETRIVKCVEELNEIFRAADVIENLYNEQLFVQNCLATFILCTLLYVTATLTVTSEKSYMFSTAAIVLFEPFVQIWICQDFTLEFSNVLKSVYHVNWIEYPPKLRKVLILTMIRLQKSPVFTLGKWAVLNISFYLNLLKMTYSFYTLISHQAK